jgi:hypothetical protein
VLEEIHQTGVSPDLAYLDGDGKDSRGLGRQLWTTMYPIKNAPAHHSVFSGSQ